MGKQFKASTKMTAKFLVVLMVLQAVLFSLTAFGAATVTGVAFTAGKGSQTLKVGATATLVATATSTEATYKAVTYSLVTASDSSYLTLDENTGDITALLAGAGKKVNVIATSVTDPTKKSAAAVITIPVPVDSVTLTKSELAVNVSKTTSTAFTIAPTTAVTKTVYWKSDDESVATVGLKTGIITGKKKGTATITAISDDNGSKTDTVTVNVYNELKTAALNSADVKGITVYLGQTANLNPLILTPMVASTIPDIADVVYGTKTLATPIITVDPTTGLITAKSVGTTAVTITVKSPASADKTLTVNVTVPTPVTKVELKNGATTVTEMGINLGKTATLTPVVTGEDPKKLPTDKTVNWTSSDETIAKVVAGKITLQSAAAFGQTVTISAYANDKLNSKYAAVLVTVTKELTTFTLQKTTAKLIKGGTFQVVPVLMSKGVSDPTVATVTYENDSKNTAVATINNNGLITAGTSAGTASFKVTATAGDGTKKVATIVVTRGFDVTDLGAFKKTEENIKVYGTVTLLPVVIPANAGNKTVMYSSDHPEIAFVNGRTGQVTGVSVGDAIITATTFDGNKSKQVTIHVSSPDAD